ncbi:MAG: DUF1543 domain-containing protein [Candidatus Paceibacterota bacterium]
MNSESLKLYTVLLGGREEGYLFEQHKYFFCVAGSLEEVKVMAKEFWRSAITLHIDAYMCLDQVCGHRVVIQDECNSFPIEDIDPNKKLFFVNLGGYYKNIFAEVHRQIFVIALDRVEAKKTAEKMFYFNHDLLLREKHCQPHVDDIASIDELLSTKGYSIKLKQLHGYDHTSVYSRPEIVITGFLKI